MDRFYVYILFRPNGVPCYVGKGTRGRWLHHERVGTKHYNKHLARIIARAGGILPKVKVREGLTEAEAIETEVALIAAIGRGKHGPLVNLTDGGDGKSGWVPSDETKAKIAAANGGLKRSDELRARLSAAHRGKTKTPEHRAKIGASQVGKIMSDVSRQKMREAAALRWARPDARDALRVYHASKKIAA